MTLSFVEAKYMATNLETCEAIWLQKLLAGLFVLEMEPIVI